MRLFYETAAAAAAVQSTDRACAPFRPKISPIPYNVSNIFSKKNKQIQEKTVLCIWIVE